MRWKKKLRGEEFDEVPYEKVMSVDKRIQYHKDYIGLGGFLVLLGLFGPSIGLERSFPELFTVIIVAGALIAVTAATILRIAKYEVRIAGQGQGRTRRWRFEIIGYMLQKTETSAADGWVHVVRENLKKP